VCVFGKSSNGCFNPVSRKEQMKKKNEIKSDETEKETAASVAWMNG
jgi:cation transport regulator ChaB